MRVVLDHVLFLAMKRKQPQSLNEFKDGLDSAFGVLADKTDLSDNSRRYVLAMRELRGKFRGKGLMKALMIEKKCENEL